MAMDGPIPGQSLTKTPRNALYERPPEIADPNEAVVYHLQRLTDPNRLDNLLFTLEYGVPVKNLTQALLTTAVSRGIHNIDVSLVIAPVIHKFIKTTAEEAGVNYLEEFENKDMKAEDERNKVQALLNKSLEETPIENQDEGFEMIQEFSENIPEDQQIETQGEVSEEVMDTSEAMDEKPRGLMSRG